jgi:hypothetical protein
VNGRGDNVRSFALLPESGSAENHAERPFRKRPNPVVGRALGASPKRPFGGDQPTPAWGGNRTLFLSPKAGLSFRFLLAIATIAWVSRDRSYGCVCSKSAGLGSLERSSVTVYLPSALIRKRDGHKARSSEAVALLRQLRRAVPTAAYLFTIGLTEPWHDHARPGLNLTPRLQR